MTQDQSLIESASSPQPDLVAASLLGEVFLAARKAKSLTQQDVSNTLRLSMKQIEALETNDFSALPEPMITRGFIRNYARLLEVDAEPLLESYKASVPDSSPKALSVQSSMHQVVSNKEDDSWKKYLVASALVLVGLLVWLGYMNFMPKAVKSMEPLVPEVVVAPAVPSSEVAPLPELALPAAERQPEAVEVGAADSAVTAVGGANAVVGNANVPASTAAVVAAASVQQKAAQLPVVSSVSTVTTSTAPITAVNVTQPNSVAKADVKPVTEVAKEVVSGAKKVVVSATERSWVSVTNKSGKVVFEKMLAAGSEESIEAQPPLNVVIGNAQATKLVFAGKAVDLASATNNNVTRLTLE